MEQQTVTIAKAGMHASLNARCSVVAAANPVYGQYDRSRRPQENIGLPDSLLSRFDLLFIVLDQIDPTLDRRLSEHVIRSHQYRKAGATMEPEPLNQTASSTSLLSEGSIENDFDGEAQKESIVWQRGGRSFEVSVGDGRAGDLLTKNFLRKYLHFSKSQIRPILSDNAMDSISTAFAGMRAKQTHKNLPVTARSLETVIRLSSAHAKVRLSNTVDEEDVEMAMELMNFVMFHEVGSTDPSGPRDVGLDDSTSRGVRRGREGETSGDDDDDDEFQEKRAKVSALGDRGEQFDNTGSRFMKVQSAISKISQATGLEQIQVSDLEARLNDDSADKPYSSDEVCNVLRELERQNKVCRCMPL